MKEKLLKTYYCGYCNKHYHLKNCAEKHEEGCTLNPNRICRLCESGSIEEVVEKYSGYEVMPTSVLGDWKPTEIVYGDKKLTVQDLKDDVDGCPICALSVIRCAKLNEIGFSNEFDYKGELSKWWKEVDSQDDRNMSGIY